MTEWTTACPDWEERIVERRSLLPCPPLYPDMAEAALGVFKSLQMTDLPMKRGGGWPTMGEVCEPFVFDLVAALFGSQHPVTGESLVKEAMLLISKKNGKSTIAAGIMLTALILNWRHGAELLVVAPTIEVANNSFGPAAKMVRADPELETILKPIDHQRIIRHLGNEAELKIVAADTGVVAGKKAGFVLVDELWQFGKKAGADSMLEEATGGQAARPEGWTLYLTTHSDEPPAGVFKSKLSYARDVRDGVIDDPTFLPMLYEWPEELAEAEAYLEPDMFYVTNPNLGKSPTVEFIQRKIRQAQAGEGTDGDTTIQIVLAKYLNVEIGMRLRRDRWRGADHWEAAAYAPLRSLDLLLERSEVAVVAVDGGGLDDLTGAAVVGRDRLTGLWLYWVHAWANRKVLKVRKEIAPMLLQFAADGDLTFWGVEDPAERTAVAQLLEAGNDAALTRQETDEDVLGIVRVCTQVRDAGLLPADGGIGVDRAAIGAVIDALVAEGFSLTTRDDVTGTTTLGTVEAVPQTAVNMNSAISTLERKLEAGGAAHGGSAMMTWCVSNAKAVQKGNSVAIDKQLAGKAKIDPLIAAIIATKLMERNPVAAAADGPSVYEDRGLVMI